MTLPDTFWSKTAPSECIVWTGALNSNSYPCFAVDGKSRLAHRLVWEDANGPIAEGLTVDHLCRVRHCVRLDHLEIVTIAENNRRSREARGLHVGGKCGSGHALVGDNVSENSRGRLVCRECSRRQQRAQDIRNAETAGRVSGREVRTWAQAQGIPIAARGRIAPAIYEAYAAAHLRSAA